MPSLHADVLVVGAGPAGSTAAIWAARAGHEVLLVDMARFPRDKTCGDGLTPRAMVELERLGLSDWIGQHPITRGLEIHGWGRRQRIGWPTRSLPDYGSVITRTELDYRLVELAQACGVRTLLGVRATSAHRHDGRIATVELRAADEHTGVDPTQVSVRSVLVADGVRSKFGSLLGRQWHRDTVYGTAVRAYLRADQQWEWLVAHLGPKMPNGDTLPGYGWLFPLGRSTGNGRLDSSVRPLVNAGIIVYAAGNRQPSAALRSLLYTYIGEVRSEFGLAGAPTQIKSALLPLGGAVSHIAGPNWMLLGDAAACVNPFTGEGIDYALETGRLAVEHLGEPDHTESWPRRLNDEFGPVFSATRRFARTFFNPWALNGFGRWAIRSRRAMTTGLRLTSNLATPADRDLPVRMARLGGTLAQRADVHRPFLPVGER